MKSPLLLLLFLCSLFVNSQELKSGELIKNYGNTFEVDSPEYKTDTTSTFKVVFDVDRSFKASKPNALIETAARFLNMHAHAGVDPGKMKVTVVIHGNAVKDILKNDFYIDQHPEIAENPNLPLLKELTEAGVEIIVCGQSAAYHEISKEKADSYVKFALSAMTALVQLQNDGYQLIKF